MKILIIGSGMYVTGRNNSGTGTVLAAVAQLSKEVPVEKVYIVSRNESSKQGVDEAVQRINNILDTNIPAQFKAWGENHKEVLASLHQQEKFDAAIIVVPDHLHHEMTKTAMELGIHCLVVKPLTPTLAEAQDLLKIQHQNKVYAAVEFHKRWDETNLYIRRALSEKKLGKLLYFTVDYSQRIDIPTVTFKNWAHQTNIFQYLGVHYVDLFYFLTGYNPVRLMAYGTDGVLKAKGIDTYDSVHTNIIWENGKGDSFCSIHNTNWIDPNITSALSDQKYKVIGTEGRIECDQKNRGIEEVTEKKGILQINPYFSDFLPDEDGKLTFGGYGYKSIRKFMIDVIDVKKGAVTLEHLEQNRPSIKDALISNAVVDAANISLAKKGEWVNVEKVW